MLKHIFCSSNCICLTLSWRRPLSYRNQSIDLRSKSMDWFLYVTASVMKGLTSKLKYYRWKSYNWLFILFIINNSFPILWHRCIFRSFTDTYSRHEITKFCRFLVILFILTSNIMKKSGSGNFLMLLRKISNILYLDFLKRVYQLPKMFLPVFTRV